MKRRTSALIALLLCAAMVLAACGGNGAATTTTPAQTEAAGQQAAAPAEQAPAQTEAAAAPAEQAPAETQAAAPAEEAAAANPYGVDWEDIAEIEMFTLTFVPPSDISHVEDAINEITEREINVHVHLNVLDVGTYIAMMGTMIAANEQIDLKIDGFATAAYGSLMAQHQLMDITDLLEKYGQNILTAPILQEKLKGCMKDGRYYAIPRIGNINGTVNIVMRKDVLEDLGLLEKAQNMTSTQEFTEILEAVHNSEKWSYLHPYQMGKGSGLIGPGYNVVGKFDEVFTYDRLGDDTGIIGVADDGKIFLQQESTLYAEAAAEAREQYAKGLVYYDISGQVASMEDLVKTDALFSFASPTNYGAEIDYSAKCGMPMVVIPVCHMVIGTSSCTDWGWEVPVTAKEPEAAVAFVNLCMVNAELNNLLAWGVEGTDYVVENGNAKYIPGTEMTAFHIADYSVPNQFLVTPWEGYPVDFYVKGEADMDTAVYSKYLGFTPDLESVSTELAACASVIEEYDMQIHSGQASEQTLQEYIDKMYASGAQKIIDAYQEQLDAWLAQQ